MSGMFTAIFLLNTCFVGVDRDVTSHFDDNTVANTFQTVLACGMAPFGSIAAGCLILYILCRGICETDCDLDYPSRITYLSLCDD